ncbi:hypothetical protein [Tenacibaculum sp. 190524A02b]
MKSKILKLGKSLNKNQQKLINGGKSPNDKLNTDGVNTSTLGCSDGSTPHYTCINNTIVGYCLNGQIIQGSGGHCL